MSIFEPTGEAASRSTRAKNVIHLIAAIGVMAVLLEHRGQPRANTRIEGHSDSDRHEDEEPSGGKMGNGTREVRDLVVAALAYGGPFSTLVSSTRWASAHRFSRS